MQCPLNANLSTLDIVYGSADDYVDPSAFTAASEATVHQLAATDHFFSGQHDVLAQTLSRILAS
jgi:alpha/beta superfamily hydrolase